MRIIELGDYSVVIKLEKTDKVKTRRYYYDSRDVMALFYGDRKDWCIISNYLEVKDIIIVYLKHKVHKELHIDTVVDVLWLDTRTILTKDIK